MVHKLRLRSQGCCPALLAVSASEISEDATEVALMARENAFGFGLVVAQHQECGQLDIPLGLLEGASRLRLVAAGDPSNHQLCTALQLRIRGLHVDHHAAKDTAELQHDAGGYQIEHDLLRRAGL